MNKASYREYLKSDFWKRRRNRALSLADYACQICKSTKDLEVHHNDYTRLGNESDSDLITLCSDHHRMAHGKKRKRGPKHDLRGQL